ncbi:DUF1003 domain-containing protein [Kitasatospora sp. NPDC089797]|uniref:DUF1003 domain-containing protein n=1 Tax=Kitasatospora sp. NPDC089797 TaxID=3155298 RepID=UPI003445BD63
MPGDTLGQRAADRVASAFGSWRFIWIQTLFVAAWMAANIIGLAYRWDPYPFILLNLVFSTQAAYAAPLILLSQNRGAERDRERAEQDLATDTETLGIVRAMADHLGVTPAKR